MQGKCNEDIRRADVSTQREEALRLLIAFRSCRLVRQYSRWVCSTQMPFPKRWSSPTTSGRSTIFIGTPPRPATWTGPRSPIRSDAIKERTSFGSRWPSRAVRCPTGSSTRSGKCQLYLLQEGDCRALAAIVSCGQDIAGDGAFSLGMITDYIDSLTTYGAGFYRNLFWEAGMVGQVLYLEAEEAGIRSTGIGCYFDDLVHEAFGIASREWQSFYHFTVGGPLEDTRLTTLPAHDFDEQR
jgi:hypothetical protein